MEEPAAARDWTPAAVGSLAALTVISTFNYLDRSLLGLALPMIKREMQVSDTVLGLVSGFAFVLFYSLLGMPIAWAADRFNRRNIIAAGFLFWSVMTVLTGYVTSIGQLAVTRFLMGAGEACGTPPSNSMIADLFRPARRPIALSLYGTAFSLASILLLPIAGWIAEHHGWRQMFVAAGLPGIVLALLFVATVREPPRGMSDRQAGERRAAADPPVPFGEAMRFLAGAPTYLWLLAGVVFMGANIYAAGAWSATFLVRVHHLGIGEIASIVGPVRGVLGLVGVLTGGVLIDRFARADQRWRAWLPALACLLAGPAELLFILADAKPLWIAGLAFSSLLMLVHQGPIYALAMGVARVRMRATAVALLLLCSSLLSQAIGPLLVGVLNDAFQPRFGDEAIRYSLIVVAIVPILGGMCFWIAGRTLIADVRRAAGERS